MTKQKWNSVLNYVIVALVFFLAGLVCSPGAKVSKTIKSAFRYTRASSQKLYDAWDKEQIFLIRGNNQTVKSLKAFEQENDTYIIYFWATWCPHCMKIEDEVMALKDASLPLIAMPFEKDSKVYQEYREGKNPFWADLMTLDSAGQLNFCQRKDEFDIPLIPSFWLVKDNKIKKVFIGKKGIKKLKAKL